VETKTRPPIGSIFHTGQKSPVSGAFSCVMCEEWITPQQPGGDDHIINVREGDSFPQCEGAQVDWRLIGYA
jgi:hypothetical protein